MRPGAGAVRRRNRGRRAPPARHRGYPRHPPIAAGPGQARRRCRRRASRPRAVGIDARTMSAPRPGCDPPVLDLAPAAAAPPAGRIHPTRASPRRTPAGADDVRRGAAARAAEDGRPRCRPGASRKKRASAVEFESLGVRPSVRRRSTAKAAARARAANEHAEAPARVSTRRVGHREEELAASTPRPPRIPPRRSSRIHSASPRLRRCRFLKPAVTPRTC